MNKPVSGTTSPEHADKDQTRFELIGPANAGKPPAACDPDQEMVTLTKTRSKPRPHAAANLSCLRETLNVPNSSITCEFYHGFIPLDDVKELLLKEGDFLLRADEMKTENGNCSYFLVAKARRGYLNYAINDERGFSVDDGPVYTTLDLLAMALRKKKQARLHMPTGNNEFIELRRPIEKPKWQLKERDLDYSQDVLGEGQFGIVWHGTLNSAQVAIKKSKYKGNDEEATASNLEMASEARTMRALSHENIVHCYGLVTELSPLTLVVEYVAGGDLHKALKRKRIALQAKIPLVLQAARGIEHIHERRIIHRDIAARNCLITKDLKTLKISDFGLARRGPRYILEKREAVAIKWAAPEALRNFTYTYSSDIWSFGVMVWEIYTNGADPYEGIRDVRAEVIDRRRHVLFPEKVVQELPSLIPFIDANCFAYEPEKRLSMTKYRMMLEKVSKSVSTRKHPRSKTSSTGTDRKGNTDGSAYSGSDNQNTGHRHGAPVESHLAPRIPTPKLVSNRYDPRKSHKFDKNSARKNKSGRRKPPRDSRRNAISKNSRLHARS